MTYIKKQQRDGNKNLILEILKAGGALTLIFTVPGAAPYFMKPFMKDEHHLDEDKFYRAISGLEKKEILAIGEEEGGVTLTLTDHGTKKALKYSLDEMTLEKPEKWDKKWRIVLFDIPDTKKVARNYFSEKLNLLGFVTIQKSVYAHPYHCEDEIELIRNVYEIEPYVKIMVADSFEGEDRFLGKFGLTR